MQFVGKTFRVSLAVAFALSVAGCSGSSPTDDGSNTDALTEAEFSDLAEVIAVLADLGFVGALAAPPAGLAAAPETFTIDPVSVACPLSGTVLFAGSVTVDDEASSISADFSQTYEGCSAAAPSSNRVFVLNGPFSYDFSLQFISEDVATFSLNQAGDLSWSTSGKSGVCPVNITVVSTVNAATLSGTATVSGSLCGRTASETVQL